MKNKKINNDGLTFVYYQPWSKDGSTMGRVRPEEAHSTAPYRYSDGIVRT